MTWKLVIPNWIPVALNRYVGQHWSIGRRLKKIDRHLIMFYAVLHRFPPATGPREVSMLITLQGRDKERDPDSMFKSVNDALVHASLLVDDSRRWCKLGDVSFQRGEQRATTISLTELD